jgi:hypothetical protein
MHMMTTVFGHLRPGRGRREAAGAPDIQQRSSTTSIPITPQVGDGLGADDDTTLIDNRPDLEERLRTVEHQLKRLRIEFDSHIISLAAAPSLASRAIERVQRADEASLVVRNDVISSHTFVEGPAADVIKRRAFVEEPPRSPPLEWPISQKTSAPFVGYRYLIVEKESRKALTITSDNLQAIVDNGTGVAQRNRWQCVRIRGFLGFCEVETGRYLGAINTRAQQAGHKLYVTEKIADSAGRFAPREVESGGWELLYQWSATSLHGIAMAQEGKLIEVRMDSDTLWEFIIV